VNAASTGLGLSRKLRRVAWLAGTLWSAVIAVGVALHLSDAHKDIALVHSQLATHHFAYVLVWLLGMAGILYGGRRMGRQSEELERARGTLQVQEERYAKTLDNLQEGCQIIGHDWCYRYVNRTAARHGRRSRKGLLGRSMLELYPGIQDTPLFRQLQDCMDQGVPHATENEFVFPDGDTGLFELYIQPVDEGLLILSLDITERHRAEQALRQNELRQRALLEALPDLVWLKDTDGVYLACNPRFERFFGATEARIVGRTDYDFVGRELADFFRENDRAAMAAGKPCVNEEEITFADDGHREHLETIKTPMFNADGELVGILGIARDITGRKRGETELQARVAELQRWQQVTLGREGRILELKQEINDLLARAGEPPRYSSVQTDEDEGG
jgi:PAS domain S-box-containing protein